MAEYSFDVGCKIEEQELQNALDMARKEVGNRFDFKGAHIEIKRSPAHLELQAPDEMKIRQLIDVIQSKLVKRDIGLKAFDFSNIETNVTGIHKCKVPVQNGLSQEQTKKIGKLIKDSKLKVQSRLQGDTVRVTSKSKNDLQAVQQLIRAADLDFDTTFENYR